MTPLEEKRRQIDALDDQIIDLLVQRTAIVEQVGAYKHASGMTTFIKPAREADVTRRVLARSRGRLPAALLVQLYREIMMASLQIEAPFTVATLNALSPVARDAFGISTPLLLGATPSEALRRMTTGEALLAVLPLPDNSTPKPWWLALMSFRPDTPNVVFRLPILAGVGQPALVVGRVPFDPSGDDVTMLAIDGKKGLTPMALEKALQASGLTPLAVYHHTDADIGTPLFLAEVAGYITLEDSRLDALRQSGTIAAVAVRGGYACPVTDGSLHAAA